MAAESFNTDRAASLPPIRDAAIPIAHYERLKRHYAALRRTFPWREYTRAYHANSGGEVWRHPRGLAGKEPHEQRHETLLADLGLRVVSLPENFLGQPEGTSPPDVEVSGLVIQLRYRRSGTSDEPTVAIGRNIRDGRHSAPAVLYMLDETVSFNIARLDGSVRFILGLDQRLQRVQVYREARGRLHLLYQRDRNS